MSIENERLLRMLCILSFLTPLCYLDNQDAGSVSFYLILCDFAELLGILS